jgi:hypothetical protein
MNDIKKDLLIGDHRIFDAQTCQSTASPHKPMPVVFINPTMLLEFIFSNEHGAKFWQATPKEFGEVIFQPPFEAYITLEDLKDAVSSISDVSIHIKGNPYSDTFFPSSKIYFRNALSIAQMVKGFCKAAGLDCVISETGDIEIFRANTGSKVSATYTLYSGAVAKTSTDKATVRVTDQVRDLAERSPYMRSRFI